ncbi:hypothetical protein NIES2100_24830 [Calothrix sp. NIES-2100]|uniref:hypothetical protein n=1 Tax=Calothrix sp. NIES-2100 TaxID=1954172 RepID=UPI000B607387|nr:hypothetical protein NIES2100_24830 [Calothrix sp. NIES-2100]
MQPIEASELKAFILALSQLDAPLPDHVQAKVNTIKIPGDISNLNKIVTSYPPLATAYDQAWEHLDAIAQLRSKGIESKPKYCPEPINTEIDNSARDIKAELVMLEEKVNHNQLAALSKQIVQALNSVKTAKDVIQTILSQ